MENYGIFEIKGTEGFPIKDYNQHLLIFISEQLQKKGIKCGKIKSGSFCVYLVCIVFGKEIAVVLFEFGMDEGKPLRSSVQCINHMSMWKRLFKKQCANNGKELESVCNIVREILDADQRFFDVQWMAQEQWRKAFLGASKLPTKRWET